MRDLIGRTLGHYRIVDMIGEGGMGEVYRAHDKRLDRDVAIKVLPEEVAGNPDRLRRFEREAKAVAALSHPNILEIFDFDAEGDVTYAVTELLEGETLGEHLQKTGGPMPLRQVQEIGASVANGLGAAHGKGVVHRDIKPSNIFMCLDGRVKILDFGLASTHEVLDSEAETASIEVPLTREGSVMGTVGYMAPEQVRGQPADHRSDIFALGCVLYELLSGRRAFHGGTGADVISAILTKAPRSLTEGEPGFPAALSGIIERCLEKSPEQRFQSARDLAFALRSSLAHVPSARGGTAREKPGLTDHTPSVAVLPFANLSADPEQEYFCDGMAEEIINALAHLEGLRVIARTSSFAFKGTHEDIREIGDRLEVAHVLEGSVRKAGKRLRITAQLIKVADRSHLWSERYDRQLEDVFAIQDEIALAIVDRLKIELLGEQRAAIVKRYTQSLDAHNAYLEGLFHWHKLSPEGFEKSHSCFEEALRVDPEFARAHVGLAMWYVSQSFWGNLSPEVTLSPGLRLAEKALAIDDGISEAHSIVGCFEGFFRHDHVEGERWLRQAVELGPNVAFNHLNYGLFSLIRERHDDAIAAAKIAQRLDPLSVTKNSWAARCFAAAGRYEEGVAELEKLVEAEPDHWLPHHDVSDLYARGERFEEARAEGERAVGLSEGASIAVAQLACVCHFMGDRDRGDELLDQLTERARRSYVAPTFLAWVGMARGDSEEAVRRIDEAARIQDPWLCFTRWYMPHHLLLDDRTGVQLKEHCQ
jgi:serine/threonine-protein kinase